MDADPSTGAELLALVDGAHDEFEAALAGLSREQMTRPGLEGSWSVKDCLAHVSFWEGLMLWRLEPALRGEGPGPAPAELEGVPEGRWTPELIDEVNRRAFEARRRLSLDEVAEDFSAAFERVRAAVGSIGDATSASPLSTFLGGSPAAAVGPDTHEHYKEHAAQVRAWREAGAG